MSFKQYNGFGQMESLNFNNVNHVNYDKCNNFESNSLSSGRKFSIMLIKLCNKIQCPFTKN